MRSIIHLAIAFALLPIMASAQIAQKPAPAAATDLPVESVTAEGRQEKDPAVERHFSQTMLVPSATDAHQYALWKKVKICPKVTGLGPAETVFVQQRIKDVAAQAGAPVDRRDSCHANALIFFTAHPQDLLDAIGDQQPERVYAYDTNRAMITQPIQSWYTTIARNWNNEIGLEAACGLRGLPLEKPYSWCGSPGPVFSSHLNVGLSPELAAALVVVDVRTVVGMSLGALADNAALRVLVPMPPGDTCKPVPSIANLMVKSCDTALRTVSLSEMDSALISGLYHSDGADQVQRQLLLQGMKAALQAPGAR